MELSHRLTTQNSSGQKVVIPISRSLCPFDGHANTACGRQLCECDSETNFRPHCLHKEPCSLYSLLITQRTFKTSAIHANIVVKKAWNYSVIVSDIILVSAIRTIKELLPATKVAQEMPKCGQRFRARPGFLQVFF